MKRSLIYFAAVAAVFALAACSDDDNNSSTITSTGDDITGSWSTGCVSESSTTSSITIFTFNSSILEFTEDNYNGVIDCSNTLYSRQSGNSNISFAGTKILDSSETVSKVNVADVVDDFVANTDAAASDYNNITWYGFTDWSAGVPQNVLGLAENGDAESTTFKDFIYVNNSASPVTIQFGLTEAGSGGTIDPEGYPGTLNTSFVLVKQ